MYHVEFDKKFKSWCVRSQKIITKYYTTNFPNLDIPVLHTEQGKKYIKIVEGNSVYAFINKENGDVLMTEFDKTTKKTHRRKYY